MFSLSLRRPFYGYADDCFTTSSCQPDMDVELPAMVRQLENLYREFYGDRRSCGESKPKKFEMKLAMRSFRPEDIKVTVEGDNVIVEAKREEKQDEDGSYSYSLREVKKTYPIPEGFDKAKLSSAFTRNGILEIEAPLLNTEEDQPTKTSISVTHAADDEQDKE